MLSCSPQNKQQITLTRAGLYTAIDLANATILNYIELLQQVDWHWWKQNIKKNVVKSYLSSEWLVKCYQMMT